jgi:hypothetical protein
MLKLTSGYVRQLFRWRSFQARLFGAGRTTATPSIDPVIDGRRIRLR